jgi:hypothetical protein
LLALGAAGLEPNGEKDFFTGAVARKAVVSGKTVDVSSRPLAAKGMVEVEDSSVPTPGAEYNESLPAATGLAPPKGE